MSGIYDKKDHTKKYDYNDVIGEFIVNAHIFLMQVADKQWIQAINVQIKPGINSETNLILKEGFIYKIPELALTAAKSDIKRLIEFYQFKQTLNESHKEPVDAIYNWIENLTINGLLKVDKIESRGQLPLF